MGVQSLLLDPDFGKLSVAQQRQTLAGIDPQFGGLSDEQFGQVLGGLKQTSQNRGGGPAPPVPAPPLHVGLTGPVDSGFMPSFISRITTQSPLNPFNWPSMVSSAFESPFSDRNMSEAAHQVNVITGREGVAPITPSQLGEGAGDLANAGIMYGASKLPGSRMGAGITGAAKGAAKGAVEMTPVTYKGHSLRIPSVIPYAAAGEVLGGHIPFLGSPELSSLGGALGATTPIVRGAIRGAKSGMEFWDIRHPEGIELSGRSGPSAAAIPGQYDVPPVQPIQFKNSGGPLVPGAPVIPVDQDVILRAIEPWRQMGGERSGTNFPSRFTVDQYGNRVPSPTPINTALGSPAAPSGLDLTLRGPEPALPSAPKPAPGKPSARFSVDQYSNRPVMPIAHENPNKPLPPGPSVTPLRPPAEAIEAARKAEAIENLRKWRDQAQANGGATAPPVTPSLEDQLADSIAAANSKPSVPTASAAKPLTVDQMANLNEPPVPGVPGAKLVDLTGALDQVQSDRTAKLHNVYDYLATQRPELTPEAIGKMSDKEGLALVKQASDWARQQGRTEGTLANPKGKYASFNMEEKNRDTGATVPGTRAEVINMLRGKPIPVNHPRPIHYGALPVSPHVGMTPVTK